MPWCASRQPKLVVARFRRSSARCSPHSVTLFIGEDALLLYDAVNAPLSGCSPQTVSTLCLLDCSTLFNRLGTELSFIHYKAQRTRRKTSPKRSFHCSYRKYCAKTKYSTSESCSIYCFSSWLQLNESFHKDPCVTDMVRSSVPERLIH